MKQYSEEISQLKRHMFWLIRDAKKVRDALDHKQGIISNYIHMENMALANGKYDSIKSLKIGRIYALKEQELLIDLQVRIHMDRGKLAREILKLRSAELPKEKVLSPSEIPDVRPETSKLIKLRREQKVTKEIIKVFERLIQQYKAGKPLLKYNGVYYSHAEFPFTLEEMEERLANYKADQSKCGLAIIKLRDSAYQYKYHKQTYYYIIDLIKKARCVTN